MKYLWKSDGIGRWRKWWCTDSVLLMQCLSNLLFSVHVWQMAWFSHYITSLLSWNVDSVILNLRSPSSGMWCHVILQTSIDIVAEPVWENSSHSSHHCEILKSHILSLLGWHMVSDKHLAFLVCLLKAWSVSLYCTHPDLLVTWASLTFVNMCSIQRICLVSFQFSI